MPLSHRQLGRSVSHAHQQRRHAMLEPLESRRLLCATLHGEATPSDTGAAEVVAAKTPPAVTIIDIFVSSETPLLIGETIVVTGKAVGTANIGDCAPPGEYDLLPVERQDGAPTTIVSPFSPLKKHTVLRVDFLISSCNDFVYFDYRVEVLGKHPGNSTNGAPPAEGRTFAAPAETPLFNSRMIDDDEELLLDDLATAT